MYIGRDGRDVVWSFYNHHANANEEWYKRVNDTPGRVGAPIDKPPASIRQYFHDWLDRDGHPFWPFWGHITSWWDIRHLPNVLLLHFAVLKEDISGQMRRIAAFLGIPIDKTKWEAILEHCSFDYMKKHASKVVPLGGTTFHGGARTFIHKGTNGQWRDTLTTEEIQQYERMAREQLGEACAHWLATGELPQ
jgi:aryl sulfotransferase